MTDPATPADFDSQQCGARMSSMWLRLGEAFEAHAFSSLENENLRTAVMCAQLADCCFWAATGESPTIDFSDALKSDA